MCFITEKLLIQGAEIQKKTTFGIYFIYSQYVTQLNNSVLCVSIIFSKPVFGGYKAAKKKLSFLSLKDPKKPL